MDKSGEATVNTISASKLRLGIVFLFLWWIPFWLAVPGLCKVLGITSDDGQRRLLIFILGLQTIFFFLGLLLSGRQVVVMVRQAPKKKLPGMVWRTLIHGKV